MRPTSLLLACLLVATTLFAADQPKLTEDELVAHHLDSLGPAAERSKTRSRGVVYNARFIMVRGGAGGSQGQAKLLSDQRKMRFIINFDDTHYNGEDLVSDGTKTAIATLPTGQRSALGTFLYNRRDLIAQGLIGGTLSAAWPLLDTATLRPKLRYNGLKKIDGRDLHEMRYEPRKGASDAKILLYFEPDTFHHVLTIYEAEIPLSQVRSINPSLTSNNGADVQTGKVTLRESFSDFRVVDGVTLPSHWTLELMSEIASGGDDTQDAFDMKWEFTTRMIVHQPMDPNAFRVP